MVKLKKYALEQIPKFVIYSLTNEYLSRHVKHIKVYDYSRDKNFQKMVNTFFVPISFNLHSVRLSLSSLMFLTSEHKDKAKFIKFANKIHTESKQLMLYLEVSPKLSAIISDSMWDVTLTLMDTWEYD